MMDLANRFEQLYDEVSALALAYGRHVYKIEVRLGPFNFKDMGVVTIPLYLDLNYERTNTIATSVDIDVRKLVREGYNRYLRCIPQLAQEHLEEQEKERIKRHEARLAAERNQRYNQYVELRKEFECSK